MDNEINIVDIVKSRRYFKDVLQFLLDKDKRLEFSKKADFYLVNSSEEEI